MWALEPMDEGHAVLCSWRTDGTIRRWDSRAGRQAGVVHFHQPAGGRCVSGGRDCSETRFSVRRRGVV